MASTACCSAGRPVQVDFTKQGEHISVDGLDVYVTGSSSRCIIFVPDIFGFDFAQVFHVADRLSSADFTVAVFDPFNGKPWPMSDFPPADGGKFMTWIKSLPIQEVASAAAKVRNWMADNKGATSFGTCGFCWGSGASLCMAADDNYKGSACCHPALFGKDSELAEAAVNPVCIISTKDDPLEGPKAILDTKPFAAQCKYQRFNDQVHGFMAARGDYSKPEVAEAAGKGIGLLAEFFAGCMPAS